MLLVRTASIVGMCLLLGGCGPKTAPRTEVFPVRGQLFVAAKPPVNARVALHDTANGNAASAGLVPHGIVEADGSFRLSTFNTHDGAPAGDYALTVVWPAPPGKGMGPDEEGPDRLEKRYADPKRPAAHVHISADTGELAAIHLK